MTPATVPDAYPPRPLVTSHSRRGGRSPALTVSSTRSRGWSIRRTRSIFRFLSRLGHEEQRARAGNGPRPVVPHRRRSLAAVFRRFAAPREAPAAVGRRRDQRLAGRREIEIAAEVHDQQSVAELLV